MEKEIMEKEKMSFYRLGKMPENKPAVRRVFEALVEFLNTAINTHFPEVKKRNWTKTARLSTKTQMMVQALTGI